jgi:hypothetical protein
MAECKRYKSTTEHWVTFLLKKDNPDVVITTRKRLLDVCIACENEQECEDIKNLWKILKK